LKRSKGYRSGTRQLLRKGWKTGRMRPVTPLLRDYNVGEKVIIQLEPSVVKGQPHRRYHGKIGAILERRGRAYVVNVQDGNKMRKIIARPDHLKSASS
jgi:large subunit ribosomal protein L21e